MEAVAVLCMYRYKRLSDAFLPLLEQEARLECFASFPYILSPPEIPRLAFSALVSSSRLVSFVSLWLHFFKVLITQILSTLLSSLIAGQRVYMLHMLLLPFLPIVALIVQNSGNLHDMMEYRMESVAIGLKVDGTTALGLSWYHFLDVLVFKILL